MATRSRGARAAKQLAGGEFKTGNDEQELSDQEQGPRGQWVPQILQHCAACGMQLTLLRPDLAAAAAAAAAPGHTMSSSEGEQDDEHEHSGSEDDEHADDGRAGSHAAAGAGPSSAAATAQGRSNKRTAGVAFQDAVSLLPADLDETILRRTLQQLQPRNRMQKQALLQSYRTHFSHWRFLLRWVARLHGLRTRSWCMLQQIPKPGLQ